MALTNIYKKSSGEVSHQTQCTMHLTEAKEVENGWEKKSILEDLVKEMHPKLSRTAVKE